MRTLITQDHATNLRDLLINYELDKPDNVVIDFTYGKGGLWKTSHEYRLKVVKCDAIPTAPDVSRKNLLEDDYSDLPKAQGAVFDPPYLYGHQAFDYSLNGQKQSGAFEKRIIPTGMQGPNSWAHNERFTENHNETVFIERVKALNRVALQCMAKDSLLFVKVMDPRDGKSNLALNHVHMITHLTNFKCYAIFIYLAGGAKTWKNHAELSHGYWMVFKLVKDVQQSSLS